MKCLLLLLPIFCYTLSHAQDIVTVKAIGFGKTLTEAKQEATRMALVEAFGAFSSSSREIINRQVVSDEMSFITNGTIRSLEVLDQKKFDDEWGVTLRVAVSPNNLVLYAKSKGMQVSFDGSLFALNIQQKLLNETAEIKSIENFLKTIMPLLQNMYDFQLVTGEPQSVDGELDNWIVPLTVQVRSNGNFYSVMKKVESFCHMIAMKPTEVEDAQNRKINLFALQLDSREKNNKSVNIYKTTPSFSETLLGRLIKKGGSVNAGSLSNIFFFRAQKSIDLIANFIVVCENKMKCYYINDGKYSWRPDDFWVLDFKPNNIYAPTSSNTIKEHNYLGISLKVETHSSEINTFTYLRASGYSNEDIRRYGYIFSGADYFLTVSYQPNLLLFKEFQFFDRKTLEQLKVISGYSIQAGCQ